MFEFAIVTLFIVLAVISPGPDFILVTRNAARYAHSGGIYTSLGITTGAALLALACISGIALVITQSPFLFDVLKIFGSSYLIYLGLKAIFSKGKKSKVEESFSTEIAISRADLFKQGLLCSALNPKSMLFFTALFTVAIKPGASHLAQSAYAFEVCVLYLIWFISLSIMINHQAIKAVINNVQHYVDKVLGCLLILLGIHILSVVV